MFPLCHINHPRSWTKIDRQTTRSQILTSRELRSTLLANEETSNCCFLSVTRLPLPVPLTAQSCRAGVTPSVPLNWNDMWAVQVSQCWTLSLGDRHSRWCYLFKFRLFLCPFSGLSVGWKVFPLSHRSVLFCQPRTTQALLKDLWYTMLSRAPPACPASKQPFFYNWTYSDETHFALHYALQYVGLVWDIISRGSWGCCFFFSVAWIKSHLQVVRDTHN